LTHEEVAKAVALALAKANPLAGQPVDEHGEPEGNMQSPEARAENLLRVTEYGAYVAPGDPHEWGKQYGIDALATIYCEQKGGGGDCVVPMDYYEGPWLDISAQASDLLPGEMYIECINSAVHVVVRE